MGAGGGICEGCCPDSRCRCLRGWCSGRHRSELAVALDFRVRRRAGRQPTGDSPGPGSWALVRLCERGITGLWEPRSRGPDLELDRSADQRQRGGGGDAFAPFAGGQAGWGESRVIVSFTVPSAQPWHLEGAIEYPVQISLVGAWDCKLVRSDNVTVFDLRSSGLARGTPFSRDGVIDPGSYTYTLFVQAGHSGSGTGSETSTFNVLLTVPSTGTLPAVLIGSAWVRRRRR
jgi:hypothetical protein